MTTVQQQNNTFELLVALDKNQRQAYGKLYWDDGDNEFALQAMQYSLIDLKYENVSTHFIQSSY